MKVYYRQRNKKNTDKVLSDLMIGINNYKRGVCELNQIVSTYRFDDLEDINRQSHDSLEIYRDVLAIGKTQDLLYEKNRTVLCDLENSKEIIKFLTINESVIYTGEIISQQTIKKTIEHQTRVSQITFSEIDNIFCLAVNFIQKYGAFMTISYKQRSHQITFSLLKFLNICHLIYEVHVLYHCLINNKVPRLNILKSMYNIKTKNIKWKSKNPLDNIQLNNKEKEQFAQIIDDKLIYLEKVDPYMRYKTDRSFFYENGEKVYQDKWNTYQLFASPLSVAIYELRMEIANNLESAFAICQNPYCNNIFERVDKRQKYCNCYECNLSRQNQRKAKSMIRNS